MCSLSLCLSLFFSTKHKFININLFSRAYSSTHGAPVTVLEEQNNLMVMEAVFFFMYYKLCHQEIIVPSTYSSLNSTMILTGYEIFQYLHFIFFLSC